MELSIGEKFFRFASGNNNRNDGRRRDDICDAYRAAENPPFENNIRDVTEDQRGDGQN